jgi:transaldolase / glucose-6-phosphate isomerase
MDLGPLDGPVRSALDEAFAVAEALWKRDHTAWADDPTEIRDRLGWLDAPGRAADEAPALVARVDALVDDGVTDAVLVGMGGSSLYPMVLADLSARGFSGGPPRVRLHVLDSTDPAAVRSVEDAVEWDRTVLVAASKSGTTLETVSHVDRFASLVGLAGDGSRRVLVVTDPGSPLARRAVDEGWLPVVPGHADVGGRYSALTPFGLLPAALVGLDPFLHADAARPMFERSRSRDVHVDNPVVLGAVLAAGVRTGRDKLTLLLPDAITRFGGWIEQMIAESTGKRGSGIVPVLGERPDNAHFGPDRLVVAIGGDGQVIGLDPALTPVLHLAWDGPDRLGVEVARWEIATAIAGGLLGINPFDQPDVARAKEATAEVLISGGELPATEDPDRILGTVGPGDYVGLLGYVAPGSADERVLHAVADRLRVSLGVPVTVGIGPRYLHSTGQLHKGGPDSCVLLIAVGDDPVDVEIPGRSGTFGRIKRAQAAGDLAALRAKGRRVAHVSLDAVAGLAVGGEGLEPPTSSV